MNFPRLRILFAVFFFAAVPAFAAGTSDFVLRDLGGGNAEIAEYRGNASLVNVPATLDGKRIVAVGAHAFFGNENLRSVQLPEGLTEVGTDAFAHCSSLKSVAFPRTLLKISPRAFFDCGKLTALELPDSLRAVGEESFALCSALSVISAPTFVESLGAFAFPKPRAGKRPALSISKPQLSEPSGNGLIDAGEECTLSFFVRNDGAGDALGCAFQLSLAARDPMLAALEFPARKDLLRVPAHKEVRVEFPISATRALPRGDACFSGKIAEPFGVGIAPGLKVVCKTRELPVAEPVVIAPSLGALVDGFSPRRKASPKKNRYALIIANETYAPDILDLGITVPPAMYAVNDAAVFEKFCKDALGVPDNNIFFYENCSASAMKSFIERFLRDKKGKELFFYYSGHGFPYKDLKMKKSYLLPTDGNPNNVASAIDLPQLYEDFGKSGAKFVAVFLDACFTGKTRGGGAFSERDKGVYQDEEDPVPPASAFPRNVVVFSAASGTQAAYFSDELKHGIFTCALLKEMMAAQEAGRSLSFADLRDSLPDAVEQLSRDQRKSEQNVNAIHSDDFSLWDEKLLGND